MPQLEGDEEEAKQGGLNTLTSKKLLTEPQHYYFQ